MPRYIIDGKEYGDDELPEIYRRKLEQQYRELYVDKSKTDTAELRSLLSQCNRRDVYIESQLYGKIKNKSGYTAKQMKGS